MAKVYVKDVHDKEQLKSVFQVARKTSTVSRGGKPFLALTLRDKTGELDARIWERVEELEPTFGKGDLVEVEGQIISFQGRPQLKIDAIAKSDGAGLDPADFAAPPSRPGGDDRGVQQIRDMIERLDDPHLKALITGLLDDEAMMADFRRAPAAKTVHHARHGGLLEHTLSVMKLVNRVADHYPMADRDLMLAGAFMHDFSKIRELSFEKGVEYTDEGRLVGHLVMAAQLIHARAARIEGFPPALEHHLTHIVLSHHGTLEFGSPRVPQTLEAMLVHAIDEMDSRVGGWLEIMQRDPNENWTDFQKLYGRHLYKGAPPTAHGKAPVERRRKRREHREEKPAAEGAAAAPAGEARAPAAEKHAEAPRERRERPERPERPERGEKHERGEKTERPERPERGGDKPERAERPERGGKKEEKLTFKPFAALAPTPPAEPEPEPAGDHPTPAAPEAAPSAGEDTGAVGPADIEAVVAEASEPKPE